MKSDVNPGIRRQAGSPPYECWNLFIDTRMFKNISKYYKEAKKSNPNFSMALERVEVFISLQYARRIYGKSHSPHFLWNKTYGPRIFPKTMSRACFMKVNRFLRFDNKDQRSQRITTDKFVHPRETLKDFVSNCQYNYAPEWSFAIDEQLFPVINRCTFIVFMPNKLDNIGMNFWVLTEVKSKYVCDLLPYLGALEKKQRNGKTLAEDVVMRLTDCLQRNRGCNITTDNFFTSVQVAALLQSKEITVVGTVRGKSKRLP